MAEEAAARRLFFALWPDDETRLRLAEATRQAVRHCGGRPVAVANLHLTLAFLGNVPAATHACAEAAADGIAGTPFDLLLDRFGHFPRPQVCWLGGTAPEPLAALVRDLTAALARDCGLPPESRPYHPHLTLARKVLRPPQVAPLAPPLGWPVRSFALVESCTRPAGVEYRPLRHWALEQDDRLP